MHSKAQASKRRKQPDAAGGANLRRNEVGACALVLQSHGPHGSLRYMVKVSLPVTQFAASVMFMMCRVLLYVCAHVKEFAATLVYSRQRHVYV